MWRNLVDEGRERQREWPADNPESAAPSIWSSEGTYRIGVDADFIYVTEGRKIRANIRNIRSITEELRLAATGPHPGAGWNRPDRVLRAKQLAAETQGMLRRFAALVSGSLTEQSQRRQTHQSLSQQFQSSLKGLEESMALTMQSLRSNAEPPAPRRTVPPLHLSSNPAGAPDARSIGPDAFPASGGRGIFVTRWRRGRSGWRAAAGIEFYRRPRLGHNRSLLETII
eukprot:Polyplicarium_translucidae@DN2333_c0_g1_i2.p1